MIDSIKLNIYTETKGNYEAILANYQTKQNKQTSSEWFTGYCGNLFVSGNQSYINISGSLPKFFHGDNFKVLQRKNISEAIEKISDELHINCKKAQVKRVDIGNNFILKEPVPYYLDCFGQARYLKKAEYNTGNPETVTYYNNLRAFLGYDKLIEMTKTKVPVPEDFKGKNILRLESQLKKNLKNTLKKNHIFAESLSDEKFYMLLIDKFKKDYFSIGKIRKKSFRSEVLMGLDVKMFRNYIVLEGIQAIGEKNIFNMLEQAKTEFKTDKEKKQFYRLKQSLKEILNLPELIEEKDTIAELDKKVLQALEYYR